MPSTRLRFLVIGYGNHAKSPIAEALLNHHARQAVATSGGICPAPEVAIVLDEIGVRPPAHKPRKVTLRHMDEVDDVLCVTNAAPERAYRRTLTRWNIDTPLPGNIGSFRRARDMLDQHVKTLLSRHGLLASASLDRALA